MRRARSGIGEEAWRYRDPFGSVYHQLVAVAWSGHMALIWDPSVSVSLSKARKTPRVPPVSHPKSVTAALMISPLFTISPT